MQDSGFEFEVELEKLNTVYQKHYEAFQKKLIFEEMTFHKSLDNLFKERSRVLKSADKSLSIWYDCFNNHPVLRNFVGDEDLKVFVFLWDIELVYIENGFELHFKFDSNPYFNDSVVIKQYKYIKNDTEEEPTIELDIALPPLIESSLPSLQFVNSFSTQVDWKKNILTKKVSKKQRNKHTNETRTITTEIVQDTFFHYFRQHSPQSEDDIDMIEMAQTDVDIADALKDDVIPNMFLFYTGNLEEVEETEEDAVDASFNSLNIND